MQTNSLLTKWQDLLLSESKRWGIQFLMMLGAIPYFGIVANIIGYALNVFDLTRRYEWIAFAVSFSVCLSYYLISLKLHYIFDNKKTFSSSFLYSVRPYIAIPLVVQQLAAWSPIFGISRELGVFILEFYEPFNEAIFHFLFISSVLLTWLLSEWVCRFQRWRARRRVVTCSVHPS